MDLAQAQLLAYQLLQKYGLGDWRFKFDNARRRFGSCWTGRKTITLSRPLTMLNPEEQVRETLLHEIAHALTPGEGHGPKWKQACMVIGAKPVRCFRETDVNMPTRRPAPYVIKCATCNWEVERRRRSRGKLVCKSCSQEVVWYRRVYR
jgi:predicted SprT family Zn-dependent metalloprotease